MAPYRVFTINPGSTSTKIALFEGETCVFSKNVVHQAKEQAVFSSIADQFLYRKNIIQKALDTDGISLTGISCCVGRGGGLVGMEGGTYEVDDLILDHSSRGANGVEHPANLGPALADTFAKSVGVKAYVVNPPDVDELQDLARITGIKGVYRTIHLHALNLKETAIRHGTSIGKPYEICNFIVCHIGGGISISAHKKGKMIDGFDIVGGEGPMAPTRCGSISVADILSYCEGKTLKEVKQLCTKTGGFVDHLGYADTLKVSEDAKKGDQQSLLLWNGMIYQIIKCIGSMATVLHGRIDGILLSGGMVYNEELIAQIKEGCQWIAPVTAYPGEFEMEAMAAGANRVLKGLEKIKKYQGICRFQGFKFDK